MNLQKLIDKQRELLLYIVQEKGLKVEKIVADTFLALQVELAEFANEGRWFKYWSHNQKPNTREYLTNYTEQDSILGPGAVWKNPLLEEFIDGLHLFLQIAILKGWEDSLWVYEEQLEPDEFDGDLTGYYLQMTYFLNESYMVNYGQDAKIAGIQKNEYSFHLSWITFLNIGINGFGFSFSEIEEAYFQKNQENHERQANGY
ncbi:hypothetical protein BME96_08890 [Virgibacillus halodenitrificans]|uniref:dUTPase n=1 Tax=Virgibacillus halodenitrificans TaxID=1482 RepID=A0AAC9NK86_VIRHA|nr:dUTP diphosphatase [Virgibacillus halodenitrificans]APC48277.1 hypothetical protein BME96_08890 [Virgibacillus halodenitrificans]